MHGKVRRQGRFAGRRPDWKKAYRPAGRRARRRSSSSKARKRESREHGYSTDSDRRTPSSRFQTLSGLRGDHATSRPLKSLTERQDGTGGRNNQGQLDQLVPGRRAQAALPGDRLQARQGRRSGQGRDASSTTRTARRASRCCTTPTARSATSSRPMGLEVGDSVVVRRRRPRSTSATRCRCATIPLGTVIHNIELKRGKGGQMVRSAGAGAQLMAQGGRLRAGQAALGRGAHGPRRVLRHRSARSATSSTRTSRSARPAASAGWAASRTTAASR